MTYDGETGYYYLLFTRGGCVEIFRSRRLASLMKGGKSKTVYRANVYTARDGTQYFVSSRVDRQFGQVLDNIP